uniref:Putative secreted protein n=1 Tax=Anopheles darlingi TaxID=43151 RepID=A0A2M4D3S8_ANODA
MMFVTVTSSLSLSTYSLLCGSHSFNSFVNSSSNRSTAVSMQPRILNGADSYSSFSSKTVSDRWTSWYSSNN